MTAAPACLWAERRETSRDDQIAGLNGRGSPGGAMQREGIRLGDMPRQRRVPGHLLGVRNKLQASRGQGGHMERLTNMASRLRSIGMVVEERAAGGQVQ